MPAVQDIIRTKGQRGFSVLGGLGPGGGGGGWGSLFSKVGGEGKIEKARAHLVGGEGGGGGGGECVAITHSATLHAAHSVAGHGIC